MEDKLKSRFFRMLNRIASDDEWMISSWLIIILIKINDLHTSFNFSKFNMTEKKKALLLIADGSEETEVVTTGKNFLTFKKKNKSFIYMCVCSFLQYNQCF